MTKKRQVETTDLEKQNTNNLIKANVSSTNLIYSYYLDKILVKVNTKQEI